MNLHGVMFGVSLIFIFTEGKKIVWKSSKEEQVPSVIALCAKRMASD
jgi:hypothetical protein